MFQPENAQSLVGLALILALCWGLSENRERFPWKLVLGALVIQAVLVLALFGAPPLRAAGPRAPARVGKERSSGRSPCRPSRRR